MMRAKTATKMMTKAEKYPKLTGQASLVPFHSPNPLDLEGILARKNILKVQSHGRVYDTQRIPNGTFELIIFYLFPRGTTSC